MRKKDEKLTEDDILILRAYADCNMTAARAAAHLSYSSGAVNYHLYRIEDKTGIDPRTFWGLTELLELLKKYGK